ncbi:venom dipeptidyl peptidase 4 isoform X2 [Drosophila hydei]|uniref:Venom dipeptidyl peptidase 4 n=1 Tax=Drosophila hydei TaxID=7224 RepID=A0A6J1LZU2_DROHY|nr:venom dipeptidyl peptidase 4 isoform X2 [Drosophila hydei]XP_030080325.1 venom dipeptidyl peptidase 4 isoform X2 [Drosophila hydei]
MSAFLDMTAAQSASVAASVCDARLSARQKASKRRSQGRRSAAATAGIHGSIASVGAGLYKSFRERFRNSAASSAVSDYRPLRQRDAEAGKLQNELNLSDSSDVESLQSSDSDSGSGSSVENLFGNETERGQWRKKKKPAVPRARRRKNLVYSKKKERRVRIIILVAGLVALALLATLLVFILRSGDEDDSGDKPKDNAIDLEDVLSGQLYAKRFNGSWSNGNSVIYRHNADIVELDSKTQVVTTLLANAAQYVLFEKSADGQLLLLAKNYKKTFRYSFLAQYDIYNLTSNTITPLTIQNEPAFLSMVQWSPVGNALIINFNRNLYYKKTALDTEIAITSNESGIFLNGIPDWVYEEEVFSSNVATWFNPTGTQIAFIQFDDSPTHVINFPYYGDAGDLRFQYPLHQEIPYPKAGSSNPRVVLFMADLERATSGKEFLTSMPVPSALNTETDYIVTVVSWLDNDNVLSIWMNRVQNAAYVISFDGRSRKVLYSTESKTGWVDLYTAPFKNRNGSRLAFVLPHDNYKQLQLLATDVINAKLEPLTSGKFVVDSILHWDATHDVIFYTANTEEHPEQLHLYAIRAVTTRKQTAKCLTCKLMTSGDVEQNYYSAIFNDNNQIVITSLGPGIPTTSVYEWSYANSQVTLKKLMDWENNDALRSKLRGVALPTHKILTVNIDGGFQAKVLLQLPPNLDTSGKTKYPMLVDVYGGPDSYSVTNKWMMDWGTYLSSNQSVIYAKIDGRGSGLRGENLLHAIYLQLGTVEISDQIKVTQNLTQMFDYIDDAHIGIWGWSYGGYAAAMALANDDHGVFKCAASIAPVTDWTYYDSIYTERYMGLPETNEVGYANSRLSTRAQKLRGKKYLLVHGTSDDNVHYQQAMILAKNLERHDILFKQISYADEDHGLVNVRPHLYHSLDRFFGECFSSSRLMKSAK